MTRVMAVGVFDLLHAGHLHYLEQARMLGDELVVVVAHDDTVRRRKHEPVTPQEMRQRLVGGLKPVDVAHVGSPPDDSMFDVVERLEPDIIAIGYDQEHLEEWIREQLDQRDLQHIRIERVDGLEGDLDGTRKIIAKILDQRAVKVKED